MATSWTQADVAALEAAIKGGTLRVRFGDREVQYQSITEMLKLRQEMIDAVAASAGSAPGSRTTYGSFSKGPGMGSRFGDGG